MTPGLKGSSPRLGTRRWFDFGGLSPYCPSVCLPNSKGLTLGAASRISRPLESWRELSNENRLVWLPQLSSLVRATWALDWHKSAHTLACVVDPKTTAQNLALLRAYGACIEMIEKPDAATGDFLTARLRRVEELIRSLPNAYWPNQYGNLDNANSHHATMWMVAYTLPIWIVSWAAAAFSMRRRYWRVIPREGHLWRFTPWLRTYLRMRAVWLYSLIAERCTSIPSTPTNGCASILATFTICFLKR